MSMSLTSLRIHKTFDSDSACVDVHNLQTAAVTMPRTMPSFYFLGANSSGKQQHATGVIKTNTHILKTCRERRGVQILKTRMGSATR